MSEMKLKQAVNEVAVEGIFKEFEFIEGETRTGKPYARGNVIIGVTQEVGGRVEESEIPISFFATKFKNDGGDNPAYKNLKELDNLKRQSVDGDQADYIRVGGNAEIQESSYYPRGVKDPPLITAWQVRGSFFSRASNVEPKAIFKTKIVLRSMEEEMENDVPTGRLKVRGIIIQYGGRADVVDYIVEDPRAVAHIMKNFSERDTILVGGYIRVAPYTVEKDSPTSMIGEEVKTSYTLTRRELVITSVSSEAFSGDDAYDFEAIKVALNERTDFLEKRRMESEQSTAAPATKPQQASRPAW